MASIRGTVRKLGLEGGLWALVTESGEQYELLDAPAELKMDGLTVEVEGDVPAADVTLGMVGSSLAVRAWKRA